MFYFAKPKSFHKILWTAFFSLFFLISPCSSKDIDYVDIQHQQLQNKSLVNSSVDYIDDFQGVSVINFTGNYDKNINGEFNSEARQAVLQEFFENNDDDYDFVYIFTEFEYDNGGLNAFAVPLMNDVDGIGRPIFDNRPLYFSENLQSIIDMSNLDSWSFSLANPSYDTLLDTMIHEFMHRWGVFIKYIDDQSQVSNNLLGLDDVHWSFFFNSNASVMYGSLWQESQIGQFKTINTMHGLSPLDLYLSGFIGKDSVTDMFVIKNATSGVNTDLPPLIGTELNGESESISINDIILYEGERSPNYLNSQHSFKVKFILLKHAEDEINPQSIAHLYILQNEFQKRFFAETNGVGNIMLDANHQETGGVDPEVLAYDPILNDSFDLPSAIEFLINSLQEEWWSDRNSSRVRDTVTVIKALQLVVEGNPIVQNILSDSILWLNNYQAKDNDEIAWMLLSGVLNSQKKQFLLDEINNNEKPSGGWGFDNQVFASPFGTTLTLNALDSSLGSDLELSLPSIQFILNNINQDYGFPYVSGGHSSLTSSLTLLKSIKKVTSNQQNQDDLIDYILSKKLPDNSYGDETGTAHETALFISVLESLDSSNYQLQIDLAKSSLDKMQSLDGSMQGSVYSTALTIQVFNNNNKPNLLFENTNISNNNVISGEHVQLNYSVKNSGAVDAENVGFSVYYNTVNLDNLISQSQINLISAGQKFEGNLVIDTIDFVGGSNIILVIDVNNDISESNEDDNVFTIPMTTNAVSNTPELVFNIEDFVINPLQFNVLPFQIDASITATNLSLLSLTEINVSLFRQEQNGDQILLQSKLANLASLETKQIDFDVEITQANTDVNLIFTIDPDNLIAEFNENNNSYNTTINKIQSVDLSISQQDLTVPNQATIGENQLILFTFNNNGTEQSSQFNVSVYAEIDTNSQLIFQSLVNEMQGGEQQSREFNWQPTNEGNYNLRFVLDEENILAETNETNNEVTVPIQIVLNALTNISIANDDLTFTPNPGLEGQDLHVSLQVHNNSAIDSGNFDINLYQKMNNGIPNVLISNLTNISTINGNSSNIIEWDILNTTLKGQQTLIAEIDPNNLLIEFNENDNLVFKDIVVLSKADAQVSSGGFQLVPSIPNIGEPISVSISVSNIGEQDLNQLSVSLYTDQSQNNNPTLVETQNIEQLSGGQSVTAIFDFVYPNDSNVDTLTVIVDEQNTIDEADELNNQSSILVGNQDEPLYVTEQYFSPNNDNIKDQTLIVFNEEINSNYTIRILDDEFKVIKNFDPNLFENTNYGDVYWDGLNNAGVVSRDGQYIIQLLSQDLFVVSSALVTLDTNKSSLFESFVHNNGYTADLNCIGDFRNRTMQFSYDKKHLYLTSYKDLMNILHQGFYKLKSDGSKIASALPPELTSFSNIKYELIKNGDILFDLQKNGINYIYQKEHVGGTTRLLYSVTNNYYQEILAITENFVIVATAADTYSKIYYDINILPEHTVFQSSSVLETKHGLILSNRDSPDHNSLYFLSFDFTIVPVLLSSDLTDSEIGDIQDLKNISNDRNIFTYLKNEILYVNKVQETGINQLFNLPISSYYGLNSHQELVVLNNDSTISIHNISGNLILRSASSYSLEKFNPHLGSVESVTIRVGPEQLQIEVDVSDRVSSRLKQEVIGMSDNSDNKEIILLVKNSMIGEFLSPACDDFEIPCDGWTETVDAVILDVMTKVNIKYSDLADIDMSILEINSPIDNESLMFSKIQEGRSSYIKVNKQNDTSQTFWMDKNNYVDDIQLASNLSQSRISSTFPWLSFSNNDISRDKRLETINSLLIDNKAESINNSCSLDPSSKYVYYSKSNLYANVTIANSQNAIEISATAFDDNFDRYEIYWSNSDTPDQWNFIFDSIISPSDGDIVLNWIPAENGLFNIKLVAYDKAGNSINDIEQIFVNNSASDIRNIQVGPQYFSPNGDGVKDEINIQYDVVGSSDVLIEILDHTGLIVRTYELEYLSPENDVLIQWDGRDQSSNLLVDGKYQISVQGFKTDVYLDTQAIVIDELSMSYHQFPLVYKLLYPNQDVLDSLTGYADYLSYDFQFYNQTNGQWGDENLTLNSTNITELINGSFRLKTEDKAGNIGLSSIALSPIKYSNSEIFKISNSNEIYSKPLNTVINVQNSPNLTDWSTGDKLAYLLQAFSYEDIEFVLLQTSYIDQLTGELVINSKLINTLAPQMAEGYLAARYIDSNINGNNLIDIQASGTRIPMLMIELEKDDFPDTSAEIEVEFQIKLISQSSPEVVTSKIQFSQPTESVILKKITFDANEDLNGLPINALNAYENIIATIPPNSNLQFFWVYQNNNIQISNDNLIATESNGNSVFPSTVYTSDFVSATDDYISRLYILPIDDCMVTKSYQWRGMLDSGNFIESNTYNKNNDFCVKAKLEALFYLGEFCSNTTNSNSLIKFEILSNAIDPRSNLPFLVELYKVLENSSEQLIFSDTNPTFSETSTGHLVYSNTYEFDTSQIVNGNHVFKLIMHDASGSRVSEEVTVQLDSFAPVSQINTPQFDSQYCALDEITGLVSIDINANVNVSSKYGFQVHLDSSSMNNEIIYQGYNSFSILEQNSALLDVPININVPNFNGQSSLILETYNSSGASYCSSVNINIDSLVDVDLIEPLNNQLGLNFISPNSDGISDDIKLVTLEAHENLNIALELYTYEDQQTKLVTLYTESLVVNEISDFYWDGNLSGNPISDGNYLIKMIITDLCGLVKIEKFPIIVDTLAPTSIFTNPIDGGSLNSIQRVVISAEDINLINESNVVFDAISEIAIVEFLYNGVWNGIEIISANFNSELNKYEMQLDWNLTNLSPGTYPIRISIEDLAGNTSVTQIIPELLASQNLIWEYSIAPLYISPNSDNIQDNANIVFGLNLDSIVRIEVFDSNQNSVKVVLDNQMFTANSHQMIFNGMDSLENNLVDGEYTIQLTVSESANLTNTTTLESVIIIDNLAPQIQWLAPLQTITKGEGLAFVELTEVHPHSLLVENQRLLPIGVSETILNSSSFGVFELLDLSALQETQYQLTANAKDLAGNTTNATLSYLIDKTAPEIELISPANDDFVGGIDSIVNIVGSINDINFDHFELSLAENTETPVWQNIHTSTEVLNGQFDHPWLIAANDGDALLRLSVYDKAGWLSEETNNIIIDNTVPSAQINQPITNTIVGKNTEIIGIANDDNFEFYSLSYRNTPTEIWKLFHMSQTPATSGSLGFLPDGLSNGNYDIKLLVQDKVGLVTEAQINLTIDNEPPSTPLNLTLELINQQVSLNWDAVNSEDLSGYLIFRNGEQINTQIPSSHSYLDSNITDGDYVYYIVAVDTYGNSSEASNQVSVTIDTTPPEVSILSPSNNQKVNNTIQITGTAQSLLDFMQFKLFYRETNQASPGNPISQSIIPVTSGLLGVLDTTTLVQNQTHIIRLEASDDSGNVAVAETTIYVDNIAPAAPVILNANYDGIDHLVYLDWDPNNESDLAGYLVYRNGIVISGAGDGAAIIANAITDVTFVADNLPDGAHVFSIAAIDQTGNISQMSTFDDIIINSREPDTIIVTPLPAEKFETPIIFEANSPDADIAEIKFEYSKDNLVWLELATDQQAPYQSTINPITLNLDFGNIYLRATAKDTGAQVDSTPAEIIIEYADLTPPSAIQNLVVEIDGSNITLNWDGNLEPDLQGYKVSRIFDNTSTLLTNTPIITNSYADSNLTEGIYRYQIVAIDNVENESTVSESLDLLVFSLEIEQPYSPILTPDSQIHISGQSQASSGVIQSTLNNNGGIIADISPTEDGAFESQDITLQQGLNTISSVHRLSPQHLSISDQVQVQLSPIPPVPTNFQVNSSNLTNTLTWDSTTEAIAYLPYRNGIPIYPITWLQSGLNYTASSNSSYAQDVADPDNMYYWNPSYSDTIDENETFIEISFDQHRWITSTKIVWNEVPSHYALQYYSPVGWIDISKFDDNNQLQETVTTNKPYLTDKIRILITIAEGSYQYIGLLGLQMEHRYIEPQATVELTEPDGNYSYQVSLINTYGFESALSEVIIADTGDTTNPETVTLNAQPTGNNDVTLNWDFSISNDVASYWLFRNDELIFSSVDENVDSYIDIGLADGQYSYYLRVIDNAGNASENSNTVIITIQQQDLPAPIGLTIYPAISGQSLVLNWQPSQSNRWHHYNIYRSLTSGGVYTKVSETMDIHFQDVGLENGVTYYYVLTTADEFDNESSYSNEVFATPIDNVAATIPVITSPTVFGSPIYLDSIMTNVSGVSDSGVFVDLYNNNVYKRTVLSASDYVEATKQFYDVNKMRLSKNGQWFAYSDFFAQFVVASVNTDEIHSLKLLVNDFIWNNNGNLLYIILQDDINGGLKLETYDKNLNSVNTIFSVGDIRSAVPSPDDAMVFYQGDYTDPQTTETNEGLWLYDVMNSSALEIVIPSSLSTSNTSIAWSNDGQNLAFINSSNGGELFIYHLPTQQLSLIDTDLSNWNKLEWSPNNTSLIYDKFDFDEKLFIYDTLTSQVSQLPLSNETNKYASFSANGEKIAYRNDCCEVNVYDLSTQFIETIFLSDNSIRDLKWNELSGILVYESEKLNIITEPGSFVFSGVLLNPGTNQIHTIARDDSGIPSPESLPIIINIETSQLPDLLMEPDTLIVSPNSALQGTHFIASAVVTNNSQQIVLAADLLIILTKPDGSTQLIEIPQSSISLQANESQSVFIDLGTQQILGEYVLQILIDPQNTIIESNENNNSAYQTFNVIENLDPILQMFVSPQIAAPNQNITIAMQVFNPFATFNGSIELGIEDHDGFPISNQLSFPITNLINDATFSVDHEWNTTGLFAGEYQLTSVLKDSSGNQIDQKVTQVEIVSFAEFDLSIDLSQSVVSEGGNIDFETKITYSQGNIPQNGTITWEIIDTNQQVIWQNESILPQMLPHFNTAINNQWLTQNVGMYQIKAVLNTDDIQQTVYVPFEVVATSTSTEINGSIGDTPANIILGEDFTISFQLVNTTSIDLTDVPITIKVLNSDLSSLLINNTINTSMTANQVLDLNMTLMSEDLTSDVYLIALYADLSAIGANAEQLLDTRSISAIDTRGPEIIIIAPLVNSINPEDVNLKFTVIDQDSEVSEIHIDGADINQGNQLDMNVNGLNNNYQYQLFNLSSGLHQFSVSATDSFGNNSQLSLTFTVDPQAPIITITGILNGIFYNAPVTANIVITDDNLLTSEILLNNQIIPEVYEIADEGNYFLSVKAEDAATNRSSENIFFVVDLTSPEIEITYPDNNAEIGELETTVTGNTEAYSIVVLNNGAYQATLESSLNGDFSFPGVPLQLGSNSITIQATDRATNTGQLAQLNLVAIQQLDVEASLQVAAENPIENDLVVNYQLQNLSSIDSLALPVKIELFNHSTSLLVGTQTETIDLLGSQTNNESMLFPTNDLLPGSYQLVLSIFFNDQWQQKSTFVFQFVDTTAPNITVLLPILNDIYNAQLEASINVTDVYSNIDEVLYEIDGDNNWQQMVNASADNYIAIIQLENGTHSIKFKANDSANNGAEVTGIVFDVDTIAPEITVNSPTNGLITNQPVAIDFIVTDEHQYQIISELNGNTVDSGEVVSTQGNYELQITATDEVNNQSQQSVQFVIDTTNPTITLTNLIENQQFIVNDISITGITEAHSSITLINASTQMDTTANDLGEFIFKNVNLNVGINNLSFIATDQANNQSNTESITVYFNSVDDCSVFGFHSTTPYNVLVFENYQAQSSLVQGRLAAGNNIFLNNYNVGAQLQASTAGDVLIAGGNIDFSHGQVHYGNILAAGLINLSQDVIDNMHVNAQIIEHAQIPINFEQSYNDVKLFSNALAESTINSSHIINNNNMHLTGDCQSPMQSYNISSEEIGLATSLSYECLSDNGYIILNITGENIDLSHLDLTQLSPIKQRLIWNLNQANRLIAHHVNIPGSILATEAHFDNEIIFQNGFESNSNNNDIYGSVNGHVITRSFNSKTKVNLFPLTCNNGIQLNAKPVVKNQELQTAQDSSIDFSLDIIDENPASLQYQIINSVNSGQLLGSMPHLTYVPETGFTGHDSFVYQVTDQYGQSSQATVNIEVTNDTIFSNDFESINKAISFINGVSITGLLTQLILWRRK